MNVRKIKPGEYREAHDLIVSIMKNEFSEDLNAYPLQDVDDISASYGNLGEAFFILAANGKVVGTVGVKREDERTALLRRIFVNADYRRKQCGSKLMDRAIEFCREVGYQEIIFKTTSRMQGAIKLCQHKGFTERAKIDLGGFELLKFTLFLKENSPAAR
ncbi:MAG: GNAT family N-acetyltransferase [Candidatus Omnitrophica bacterium]|nr:GNAT family N-acetyltransferase [Candidatus Omnitrophota bacterium]